MPNTVPFTAYFRMVPERGEGKRFEIWRSRERIARLVWLDLNTVLEDSVPFNSAGDTAGTANFAVPGGTITWSLAQDADSNSSSMNAVAFKPQFGESPDQLTVVGFVEQDDTVPYGEKQLISGGRVWNGPAAGAPGVTISTMPTTANQAAAAALKALLEASIISVPVEMIKLEINGVAYGRGAIHFPRP